jgi:hypothetical protein
MVSNSNKFPNRGYYWRLESSINWQSGTRVSLHVELHIDGDGDTYSSESKSSWELTVQGVSVAKWGPATFDFRNGTTRLIHVVDLQTDVQPSGKIDVDAYASYDIMGYIESHVDVFGNPPTVPPAPTMWQPNEVTTTSMRSTFSGNGDGGSPVTSWQLQYATDAAFTANVVTITSNSGTDYLTGLTPGTTYWLRARGTNAAGTGAWATPVSQATLPVVPPGLTVGTTPSGTSALLTFSPPGGVSGITKYTWERRVTGTVSPVATGDSQVINATITGLTPGTSYDWRASAWMNTYQSPWSDWQTVVQPKPNVSPGDYFDGSSTDVADVDYGWTGTVGGSTSTATAAVPEGWEILFAAGAAGALMRATSGLFSASAARAIFHADETVAGTRIGQRDANPYRSEISPAATYFGSIHVRPSRAQSLAVEIRWLDAAGVLIGAPLVGTPVVVASDTWTRLSVSGLSPATAELAVVRAVDVAGAGWAAWKGGDTIDLDGAMLTLGELFPYFDGSTADDTSYDYAWLDPLTPHASPSTRTPLAAVKAADFSDPPARRASRALIDPDCAVVPSPPRPPTIPDVCIIDTGIWRRYYGFIQAPQVSDWLATIPTLEVTTGSSDGRQLRVRYYANPDNLPAEQVDTTAWVAEQIISYLPAHTLMTLEGMTQRAWAEVEGDPAVSADHLLYGTNGRPAVWPVLDCGISYLVTLEAPTEEPAGNITVEAYLTTRA